MTSIAAGEDLHLILRLLNSDLKNLPLLRRVRDFFFRIFYRSDEGMDDLTVAPEERYQINAHNWLFNRNKHHSHSEDSGGGDPHDLVFNVLDTALDTMYGLKKIRRAHLHGWRPQINALDESLKPREIPGAEGEPSVKTKSENIVKWK